MPDQYILALDQGTTSSRAIVFDRDGGIVTTAQKEFTQIFPRPGWVEHDPNEIWSSQIGVAAEALSKANVTAAQIAAIGITNQRETTLAWNRRTGQPVHNAIVWQDRRTADTCRTLQEAGHADMVRRKTGLVIDPYFSGTKLKWILDNVEGARALAEQGDLLFGTVDTWLIWKLTGGELHITDVTNASRTLLYNIHELDWDRELLELLGVPASVLPQVRPSSQVYGRTSGEIFATRIPIAGIAGDQQAALFGQVCTKPGMAKNTYGTGCFMLMNTGEEPIESKNNLITTIAWQLDGERVQYALEGGVFIAGAVVQWLRDGLGFFPESPMVEQLAGKVQDPEGVYLVPAFAGLGAPHWDPFARGIIVGITRGTTSAHISRAALDSIAYQSADVLRAMVADSGISLGELRVDGGASVNDLLMQFQADILDVPVIRPTITETTALGAAYLAGLATGFWESLEQIAEKWKIDERFQPAMEAAERDSRVEGWNRAVERSRNWVS